ncbi:MAG: methyltransferase domain-containing protein [Coleofasciculaceae cyanobacterium]
MSIDFFGKKQQLFDLWAPNYDCLLTTVFYQAVHKRLLEYVELKEQGNVLDLGCGTGRLLNRLAQKFPHLQGTGLDLSGKMIEQAKQQNQYEERLVYRQGNGESMPFADNQFDAVFNTISFLHYPNPLLVLSEVSRILRPDGRFYLVDYSFREDLGLSYFPLSPGGLRFYSPQQRERLGTEVGLTCLEHQYLLCRVVLTIFAR